MRARVSILRKKLAKANEELNNILKIYKNSEEDLKKLHAIYEKERSKKRRPQIEGRLKKANFHYLKSKRLVRRIKKMSDELHIITDDSSTESSNNDSSTEASNNVENICDSSTEASNNVENHTCHECSNCKRRQNMMLIALYGEDSPYHLKFSFVSASVIHNRKFKHRDIDVNEAGVEYPLCTECEQYLTLESGYHKQEFCWPSFILCMLSNEKCHRAYGNHLWTMIPREFRFWWLIYLKESIPQVYHDITIDYPYTNFDDITIKMKKWNECIDSATLPNLAHVCNESITPSIMCPWGDSVFIHKTGTLPIDVVFQRFLQSTEIVMIDHKKFPNVQWCRDDYIRVGGDADVWLLNQEWKVRPSIAFIDGVPKVLTCQDHNGGSTNRMIHPLRWSHNLPCEQPDQIAQVVTQSRTVKKARASAYSSEWQMYEQRGCFAGLDTCNHVEFGNFERHSILRHEVEDRAIGNRFDVNLHLDTLHKNNIISNEMVKNMRESSKAFNNERQRDLRRYKYGATYVPLEAAIAFQQDALDRTISITIPSHYYTEDAVVLKISRYWPKVLYPCHPTSLQGCQVELVPIFSGGQINKKLWQIVAIITQVEEVWYLCTKCVTRSTDWLGWILVYVTKKILHVKIRQHSKDPFKAVEVGNINKIRNKLPNAPHIVTLIRYIKGSHCIELDSFAERDIELIEEDGGNFEDEVLILASSGPLETDYHTALTYMSVLKYENKKEMELRCIISTNNSDSRRGDLWNGEIFTRHGNGFSNFWYQHRGSKLPIKKHPEEVLLFGHEYILIYCLRRNSDMTSIRNRYIEMLGGQFHVQCNTHKKPLICCYEKEKKCQCGKKAVYTCGETECNTRLCKNCFKVFDNQNIHFINSIQNDEDSSDDDDDINEQMTADTELISNDIIENYVTVSEDNEILVDDIELMNRNVDGDVESDDPFVLPTQFIPTTNTGEVPIEVVEKVRYGFKFSGCNILNNVGSLLTRSHYDIRSSKYINHHIQKLCSVTNGNSIPLLYAEGMLFPSIHWKTAEDKCSVIGAIPSSLLNVNIKKEGFASVQEHIRTRLTTPSSATSSDPRYIAHCYDVMANMAASQSDTRLIVERGLTVPNEKGDCLGVRGSKDSELLGSVDSKQMVKNLCTSQKKVKWSYFLTYTANHTHHFGLKKIRDWINKKGWSDSYPNYKSLSTRDQKEIDNAVSQASLGLITRIWEEVSKLFLDFLVKSEHSPWKKVAAVFARREYQKESGNVAHSHIILAVDEENLTAEELNFVHNLAAGSIFDVVKSSDINDYIDRGLIRDQNDINGLSRNAALFLTHTCSDRCLIKTSDGRLVCRVPKYMFMTLDNTKQCFADIPVQLSDECWSRLHKIGIANSVLNELGERNKFKSSLDYFHPKRWIPPVSPGEGYVSPYERETFAVCQSMQNVQRLDQAGGCCKYTLKYLTKVDKQNYISISLNKEKKAHLKAIQRICIIPKSPCLIFSKKKRKKRGEMLIIQKGDVLVLQRCCM